MALVVVLHLAVGLNKQRTIEALSVVLNGYTSYKGCIHFASLVLHPCQRLVGIRKTLYAKARRPHLCQQVQVGLRRLIEQVIHPT